MGILILVAQVRLLAQAEPGGSPWIRISLLLLAIGFLLYRLRLRRRAGPVGEAATVLAGVGAYFLVRGLTEGHEDRAMAAGWWILRLEEWLGIDWEVGLQANVAAHHGVITLFNWVYIWGHWPVIVLSMVWLYLRRHDEYRLLRNSLLVSGVIGILVFVSFPVAPPRFIGVGMVDTVTLYSDSYRVLQPPAFIDRFAAFPSLHFGWNLLVGVALYRSARTTLLRCFAVLLPVAMGLAIVLTANHYLLDAVGGGVAALAGLLVAQRFRVPLVVGQEAREQT